MRRSLIALVTALSLSTQIFCSQDSLVKRRMESDLNFLQSTFEVQYAPLEWKREHIGFDLESAFDAARAEVQNMQAPTTKEFHHILRRLFNQTADYHVGVSFHSTESATLPFMLRSAVDESGNRRYFFAYLDEEEMAYYSMPFPFALGDEVMTWNSRPIDEVVQEFKEREFGLSNTAETDQTFAEMFLTARIGMQGFDVPSGDVILEVLPQGETRPQMLITSWDYYPERVRNFAAYETPQAATSDRSFKQFKSDPMNPFKERASLNKLMVGGNWHRSSVDFDNPHALGGPKSYLPQLGKKVWSTWDSEFFDAYIFRTPNGKRVGVVRITDYMGDVEQVDEFVNLMNTFSRKTDALIIDQLNNPGGSLFYLYGLAATLAEKPLKVTKHRVALTQQEIFLAVTLIPYLEELKKNPTAFEQEWGDIGGCPLSMEDLPTIIHYFKSIVAAWNAGQTYTEALPLMGINEIRPHPKGSYKKPILFLTNELDFSGGDFLPALLQDNNRVTVLGNRTAGAGGFVTEWVFPNHNAISDFKLTGSLAERVNREPLENLGVTPDIKHVLTVRDLQEGYCDFMEKVLTTIDEMIIAR